MPIADRDDLTPRPDAAPPLPDRLAETDTHSVLDLWVDLGGSD